MQSHTIAATSICWISYGNGYIGLLDLHFLLLLKPRLTVEIQPAKVIFKGITQVGIHMNCLNWFLFLIIVGYYKDVYCNSFFSCRGRAWSPLPVDRFPLTYDLNGFKSGVNRNLLLSFFLISFCACFSSFPSSFSCNSMPCSVCSALCGINLN